MKLSEAILLGSTIRPQSRKGVFFDGKHSCAFGAALEAVGVSLGTAMNSDHDFVAELWPFVRKVEIDCPSCGVRDRLWLVVGDHLNDRHKWTRERIAEWVASIEPKAEECSQGVADPVTHSERSEVFNL